MKWVPLFVPLLVTALGFYWPLAQLQHKDDLSHSSHHFLLLCECWVLWAEWTMNICQGDQTLCLCAGWQISLLYSQKAFLGTPTYLSTYIPTKFSAVQLGGQYIRTPVHMQSTHNNRDSYQPHNISLLIATYMYVYSSTEPSKKEIPLRAINYINTYMYLWWELIARTYANKSSIYYFLIYSTTEPSKMWFILL